MLEKQKVIIFIKIFFVARIIYESKPKRHLYVGSRFDGFVSNVVSFRPIEVVDIRPMDATCHENIKFVQADLVNPLNLKKTDSLSCLHAIEHFGLGRYGDPIDVDGHMKGITNLLSLIEINGILYISFPIGKSDEVYFNAHRILYQKVSSRIKVFVNIWNLLDLIM